MYPSASLPYNLLRSVPQNHQWAPIYPQRTASILSSTHLIAPVLGTDGRRNGKAESSIGRCERGQSAKAAQFSGSLLSQTAVVLYDSLKPEQSYGRSVRVNLDLEATLLPRLNRSAMLEAERLQTPAEGDHVLCEWPAYCNATLGTGQRVAKCGQILAWDCR